jgi:hypothetical protein
MTKKTIAVVVAVALFGSVLGTAAVSSAQYNIQIHMGAECRPFGTLGDSWRTVEGYMVSTHSTENTVVLCPLIRETPDVVIDEVRVAVEDNHDNANKYVQCKVTCFEDNDYTISSSGTGYEGNTNSPNTFTGYDTITISAGDITEYNDGRCFLNCEIPDVDNSEFSAVVSYQATY